jgi:hypothetical protein
LCATLKFYPKLFLGIYLLFFWGGVHFIHGQARCELDRPERP